MKEEKFNVLAQPSSKSFVIKRTNKKIKRNKAYGRNI